MAERFKERIIIITAPSGAGKTSITKYLLNRFPDLAFSISATTRQRRENETHGKDYYFITIEEFNEKIHDNAFVEWEMVYEGKYYGTLKSELERIWQHKQTPILDIDVKGAIHVQQQYLANCLSIFIEPPSIEELKRRLESRGTEDLETMHARVNKAGYEISFKHHFHKVIVNHNLTDACREAEDAVQAFLSQE